jgi:hypothetical protein
MKEIAEFRVDEAFAPMLFAGDEGKRLGDSVRKVLLDTGDPRYEVVGRLQREVLASTGKCFFYGWKFVRQYTRKELQEASLFTLLVTSFFEPAGEDCGTRYDESTACRRCGSGAARIGPLRVDTKRIRKLNDFAATIADEVVVSRRAVELFEKHRITGAEFAPVRKKKSSAESEDWFSMTVESEEADIVAPTQLGNEPFDDDPEGEYRCPLGDLIGLNLLSEVSIKSTSCVEDDIICSRQFIGTRRGVLRPRRVILISPKAQSLIHSEALRGLKVEVAHLV